MSRASPGPASFSCPHCGADVAARSSACRQCGSDLSTGWNESAEADGLELPDEMDADEYDEFLARELPAAAPRRQRRRRLLWTLAALALAAIFLLASLIHG